MMIPEYYEFSCPVKILSGFKALSNLPYEMDLLGTHKALIVTDQGVVGAGLIKLVESVFEGSQCEIGAIFDRTPPDSSTRVVQEVARLFVDAGCDCFVAVGGGSSMDTAKCANMMVTEGGDDLTSLQGVERLKKPVKAFIAVPTTAGTGSEVTVAAVIYDENTKVKMGFTSYRLLPSVAILDPKMTMTMPPKITAATGMDALTHAIEAYYCLQKNPVSDSFAVAAIKLIVDNLVTCVENGKDETARLAMANAALLAGISFSNSMVGVVHSLAHACGGVCRVPHGIANGILLPWGMENNLEKVGDTIAELAPLLGAATTGGPTEQAKAAVQAVRDIGARLKELCGFPTTLREAGVTEDKLEDIAKATINDGAITLNPEDVTYDVALEILRKAY
jgi:alcohol dehydrogenase